MHATRRLILKAAVAGVALLALPRALLAWPKAAFDSKSVDGAMKELFGADAMTPSDAVVLTAPDIAENGAVVPITISTTLEGAESIGLIVKSLSQPCATGTVGAMSSNPAHTMNVAVNAAASAHAAGWRGIWPSLSDIIASLYTPVGYIFNTPFGYGQVMTPETRRNARSRLARIEGQVRGLVRMIDGDRYCIDVITQIQFSERSFKKIQAFHAVSLA